MWNAIRRWWRRQIIGPDPAEQPEKKILITLNGGLVQKVFCTDPEFQIAIVDWDVEDMADEDIVSYVDENGDQLEAFVRFQESPDSTVEDVEFIQAIEVTREARVRT